MNELIERFLDLPPRQRILLIAGGVLLVLFLYVYLLYWPRAQEIEAKERQVVQLEAERDRKAKLAANLNEARALVTDLEAALKEAVTQLPDTKEIPDLLSAISSAGRESGLEIIQFRQRPEQFKDFYAEVPVDMLVRGTFFQMEAFVARVSELQRIVNVDNITIRSPQAMPTDPIRVETSCAVTTFRFLDEAERERIARQRKAQKGKK